MKSDIPELKREIIIKVVGIGGAGGNTVNRMVEAGLRGVEFISINTDSQALEFSRAETKLQIGANITKGLGAGTRPEIGRQAAEEDRDKVVARLLGADLVIVTAGMGGGTGTGAAPVIAEAARELGALTIAIVTKPFEFEGRKRMKRALAGIDELRSIVDTLIALPLERLLLTADPSTKLTDAFLLADDMVLRATRGISDIVTTPSLIKCDFAEVRTAIMEMNESLMGIGHGKGQNRAAEAARQALSSPFLENISFSSAERVLINVTGSPDLTLQDVDQAKTIVNDAASPDAKVIFGSTIDPDLRDEIRVTVYASGHVAALAKDIAERTAERPRMSLKSNKSNDPLGQISIIFDPKVLPKDDVIELLIALSELYATLSHGDILRIDEGTVVSKSGFPVSVG